MRTILCTLIAFVLLAVLAPVSNAQQSTGRFSTGTEPHPAGACLGVSNPTNNEYTLAIDDPAAFHGYKWTILSGISYPVKIGVRGTPFQTDTGNWTVSLTGPRAIDLVHRWEFEPQFTYDGQCPVGTWVLLLG